MLFSVSHVKKTTKGQKRESCVHLGIEEAGGSLDNGGAALIRRHLEDDALCVGEDGEQMQAHILRVHVEHKRVGKRLCLARLNLQAVLHDGQVAHNALVGGHVIGKLLGRPQRAVGEEELDGPVLVVGDLDEGRRGAAIDQLEAEDVGVGERGSDVGVEGGGFRSSLGNRLLELCSSVSVKRPISVVSVFFPRTFIVTRLHGDSKTHAPLEQLRQRPARPEKRGETT